MAFPVSPINGEQYTNALGTTYQYYSADTAWKIVGGGGGGGGTIKGSGFAGYLSKFTDATTLAISPFYVDGDYSTLMSTKSTHAFDSSNLMIGGAGPSLADMGSEDYAVRNTTYGIDAGELLTEGSDNVLIGTKAGYLIRDSGDCVIIGSNAGQQVGHSNVVIGSQAMTAGGDMDSNVAIGTYSMLGVTYGNANVAIGANSCNNPTDNEPSKGVYIGFETYSSGGEPSKEVVIGSGAVGLGSNSVVLGDTENAKVVMYGNTGFDNTSPLGVIHPKATGLNVDDCAAYTLGNTDASWGTFTRDIAHPTYYRTDTGDITWGGLLKIIGHPDSDTDTELRYTGHGYVWSQAFDSVAIRRTHFTFDDQVGVTLYNTLGDCFNYDIGTEPYPDGLCIFVDSAENGVRSTNLSISNYHNLGMDQTARMGYEVTYWYTRESVA